MYAANDSFALLIITGLEDTWTDNSHLKRKSCLEKNESADSDESDSEVRGSASWRSCCGQGGCV